MTSLQKYIIGRLLLGYAIAGNKGRSYRLRSADGNVCRKFYGATFRVLEPLLRIEKDLYVIDKSKVRQLHGGSWAKKRYKDLTTENDLITHKILMV